MDYYLRNVSDAEYALLCHYWSQAAESQNPLETFCDKLQNLPENDPIRELSTAQMNCVNSADGFSALTIKDNNGNALVIFAGTNAPNDYLADVSIFFGIGSSQSKKAISLINDLSKECKNIVVTGHSLGGYLATSSTLKNQGVTRCVAFDSPGRNDVKWQELTNEQAVSKVTTYVAGNSEVSSLNEPVGNTIYLNKDILEQNEITVIGPIKVHNHKIDKISDALGGVDENTWSK